MVEGAENEAITWVVCAFLALGQKVGSLEEIIIVNIADSTVGAIALEDVETEFLLPRTGRCNG